jgi:UDP-N-acetylglucosamine 1-carboxyvinyltransferase
MDAKPINIQIEGGHKLSGTVVTKTSKNGAMGLLAASLLNRGQTTLKNVPKIEEVFRMVEVFQSIGIMVGWVGNDLVIKPPKDFSMNSLDSEAAKRTRSIIMLIGPLIHSLKKFSLPQPGGCKLGSRTVKPHLFAL